MQQRLEQFINSQGITKAQFAESINVARAVISHIIAGRNKPSYEFIVNTMNSYPSLNIEWLLSGRGEMLKDGNEAKITGQGSLPDSLFDCSTESTPSFDNVQKDNTPEESLSDDLFSKPEEPYQPRVNSQAQAQTQAPSPSPSPVQPQATPSQVEDTDMSRNTDNGIKRIVVYFRDGTYRDFVEED